MNKKQLIEVIIEARDFLVQEIEEYSYIGSVKKDAPIQLLVNKIDIIIKEEEEDE